MAEREGPRGESGSARPAIEPEHQDLGSHRMEALGRLAAGISHDFKNLLTAILGNCHLMLEDPVVEQRVGDILRETLEAAGTGAEIVSQLMRFSGQPVADQRADVSEVIERFLHLVRRFVGEDVTIISSIAAGPLHVRLGTGQIEQVVMNLVVNAREAMPAGGALSLSVGQIQLGAVGAIGSRTRTDVLGTPIPPGDYVVIIVADDGIGMSAEVRQRVLEPFFTTKGSTEGARGLGLSTVYGLVTGAGGWVALRSEPERGTVVTVYLPVTDDAPRIDLRDHP